MSTKPRSAPATGTSTGLASMTGFGEAHAQSDKMAIAVEVRTINSRHLKLSLRASDSYSVLEPEIDALVRQRIRRGTVQLNLKVSRLSTSDDYQINLEVLQGYHRQLDKLSPEGAAIPLESLLPLPGVVVENRDLSIDPKQKWPMVQPVVEAALDNLSTMRIAEGQALAADLIDNCQRIAEELTGIESRAPDVVVSYRDRLVDRVNKALNDLNVNVEPADLIKEVAVFADRSDISEEVVRLRSHIEQLTKVIESGGDASGSGRKLEFITQEMGREVNTIGSKANDTEISHRVVEIKTALERIREQVQNVE